MCAALDITAMMTVMDVSPGDVVLEAGSGSGASSLFLSRAVGAEGCVYSFEMRSDHHAIAKSNYDIWRNAWQIRSGRPWPDNVRYIKKNILKALPDIKSIAFDGAVLDMLHPQIALPIITGNLKQGAVCAIYLANITQVIDLLEGLRVCKLPLLCETVMEVYLTKWLVTPSRQKDGTLSRKVSPRDLRQDDDKEEDVNEMNEGEKIPAGPEPFGQVPYLARPMPTQLGHTAFLVLLRKFKPAPPRSEDRM
ncbi:tRNA (adenine(58)-N(1))-methyltransferase, mitochondrial isoform X2 [Hyperolius riggenbachi]|uniref:tRNA (adenine(58)-N(1))-methyltransferase, mitochondrial isoform X2 n=1 Tax=Hyperolius riggenbachi TaxID=752182 RepID=UPI0035A27CBF